MSMILKVHAGDGVWQMHEVQSDLRYMGSHVWLEFGPDDRLVTIADVRELIDREGPGHPTVEAGATWFTDDRLPIGDCEVIEADARSNVADSIVFVHWAAWRGPDGRERFLITGNPIFICNADGDTIESLR